MENVCSFEPLWQDHGLFARSDDIVDDLQARTLQILLKNPEHLRSQTPNISDIITTSAWIIDTLLSGDDVRNDVVQKLHSVGQQHNICPILLVKKAMGAWYQSSAAVFNRDPNQGRMVDSEDFPISEFPDTREWNYAYAAEQHHLSNTGLMGVIMITRSWTVPHNPGLKAATLISNAATSIMFAASIILPHMTNSSLQDGHRMVLEYKGIKLLLKTIWRLARDGNMTSQQPPAVEFGATLEELKLEHDGKYLMTKIGRSEWHKAPYWHPCHLSVGSPWGKYIKNVGLPMFPDVAIHAAEIKYRLPSSAMSLTQPYEAYFAELRFRYDQKGRERRTFNSSSQVEQYERLADTTGQEYPTAKPTRDTASTLNEYLLECQYVLPLVKKPITDQRGNITLAFASTAVRALRFEDEPDEIEPDFVVMEFTKK